MHATLLIARDGSNVRYESNALVFRWAQKTFMVLHGANHPIVSFGGDQTL